MNDILDLFQLPYLHDDSPATVASEALDKSKEVGAVADLLCSHFFRNWVIVHYSFNQEDHVNLIVKRLENFLDSDQLDTKNCYIFLDSVNHSII